MHSVMSVVALVNISMYVFYYSRACRKSEYYIESDEHMQEYHDEVSWPLLRFTWISFLILGVIFFATGCIMLNRLRLYFVDFYKESGCKLWTANILLTLPLTFRAIFDGLAFND